MKMRNIILFICFFSFTVNAQENNLKSNIYDFNHFSFELQTNYSRTEFQIWAGNEQIEDQFDDFRLFQFGYQFHFGQSLGFQIKTGIGYRPYLSFFTIRRLFLDNPSPPAIGFLQFIPFGRLGLSGNYHKQFKNNVWGIDALFGGAVSFYPNTQLRTEVGIFGEEGQQQAYLTSLNYQTHPVFILNFSFGITKTLEKNNMLGLYLVGEYHFDNMLTGTYNFQDIPANGRVFNNGNSIALKLKYSFVGKKKMPK